MITIWMERLRRAWLVPFALGGLVLWACGGDDDAEGSATPIVVDADEYEFVPDSWNVPAGEPFTVDFENRGQLDHEWTVIALEREIETENQFAESRVLVEIERLPGGESTTEQFTIDDAGTYQVVCVIPGHFDAGMEGTLLVE